MRYNRRIRTGLSDLIQGDLTPRLKPPRAPHSLSNTMIRHENRQRATTPPLRSVRLRLVVVLELESCYSSTTPHVAFNSRPSIALRETSAGNLPRPVRRPVVGFAMALRATGRWRTRLCWGDGVFDRVVVGDAAAVFPIHGVVVIWETAVVTGILC
jgi:hypothetical protein